MELQTGLGPIKTIKLGIVMSNNNLGLRFRDR